MYVMYLMYRTLLTVKILTGMKVTQSRNLNFIIGNCCLLLLYKYITIYIYAEFRSKIPDSQLLWLYTLTQQRHLTIDLYQHGQWPPLLIQSSVPCCRLFLFDHWYNLEQGVDYSASQNNQEQLYWQLEIAGVKRHSYHALLCWPDMIKAEVKGYAADITPRKRQLQGVWANHLPGFHS